MKNGRPSSSSEGLRIDAFRTVRVVSFIEPPKGGAIGYVFLGITVLSRSYRLVGAG